MTLYMCLLCNCVLLSSYYYLVLYFFWPGPNRQQSTIAVFVSLEPHTNPRHDHKQLLAAVKETANNSIKNKIQPAPPSSFANPIRSGRIKLPSSSIRISVLISGFRSLKIFRGIRCRGWPLLPCSPSRLPSWRGAPRPQRYAQAPAPPHLPDSSSFPLEQG